MNPEIEAKLRLCPRLPTLSGVAVRIVTLAHDPDVDLGKVTRLLSNDPALAAKMLRVANSSLYKRFREVHGLRQAVTVLGLNATITLTLSFSLAVCIRGVDAPGIDLDHFWRRALLSALAARLLGERTGTHSLEDLFLAGLLQDIGMLALDAALPEQYASEAVADADHETLIAKEREVLATDHREVGAWLMREWHLPEYLSLATLASHDLDDSRDDVPADLASFTGCVAVSGRLADIYLSPGPESVTLAQNAAEACLGLSEEALNDVLARLVESLPEVEELFGTSVLSATQAMGLTDQARELLACRNLQLIQTATRDQSREDEFKQLASKLHSIARRDDLTGVFNRRHFDEVLENAFAEAGGERKPLSVAYLDLDHFKSINDHHGHLVGDTILSTVARHIQSRLRENDLLARYGGEEFVVLMPELDQTAACRIVDRIRVAVEALMHPLENGETLRITLSAGVASYGTGESHQPETPTALLEAADRALYEAKHRGRNQVAQAD